MYLPVAVIAVIVFVAGSMIYVYRFRGKVRYTNLNEYLRKGWPIFAPLNCLLYLFTEKRAKRPIMDLEEFPELGTIRQEWGTIRSEARALYDQGYFALTNAPDSRAYYDIGFRTFYKYGWSKFYLTWYGYTHDSAQALCPNTCRILAGSPSVNGAMFSLLPPGGKLTRHLDPVACSLRYHLGLITPNDPSCFINIDGVSYAWSDGDALLFDETYLHYAQNDSDAFRLILMCDVNRPMTVPGRVINAGYKALMRLTVVPNLEGDKRGLTNRVFSMLDPLNKKRKALKATNRRLYRTLKYGVNAGLLLLLAGALAGSLMALF